MNFAEKRIFLFISEKEREIGREIGREIERESNREEVTGRE